MWRMYWIACFCLAVLAGCATGPDAQSIQTLTAGPKAGHGVVYIGRPSGWNVSYVPLSVELDGRSLAQLSVNTYTRVELPPGTYKVAATDSYMTKITYGTPRPLHLKVDAGKSYYVLPTRSVENVRPNIQVIGTHVVAGTTGDTFGSFAVEPTAPGGTPPAFAQLSFVAPEGRR